MCVCVCILGKAMFLRLSWSWDLLGGVRFNVWIPKPPLPGGSDSYTVCGGMGGAQGCTLVKAPHKFTIRPIRNVCDVMEITLTSLTWAGGRAGLRRKSSWKWLSGEATGSGRICRARGRWLGCGGTVRNQGERAGRDLRGLNHCRRELAQGTGARGPDGGRRRRGSPGIAGLQDLRPLAAQSRAAAVGEGSVWEGILRAARNGRLASVCRPAHLEAGMRQGKPGGLEFCSLGPRLWLPGSGALGSLPPCPILFPENRPSIFLLPGPPSHPSLPCSTLLPSGHASSTSPSPLAKNTVLLNSDLVQGKEQWLGDTPRPR